MFRPAVNVKRVVETHVEQTELGNLLVPTPRRLGGYNEVLGGRGGVFQALLEL